MGYGAGFEALRVGLVRKAEYDGKSFLIGGDGFCVCRGFEFGKQIWNVFQ